MFQNLRDLFWNFVFYKFIFIFGILNVTQFSQLLLWSIWFSMFSFLRLMNQLSKDRFDYVSTILILTQPFSFSKIRFIIQHSLNCAEHLSVAGFFFSQLFNSLEAIARLLLVLSCVFKTRIGVMVIIDFFKLVIVSGTGCKRQYSK